MPRSRWAEAESGRPGQSTCHPQAYLSFSQSSVITSDGNDQRKAWSRWLTGSTRGSNQLAQAVWGLIKTAEGEHHVLPDRQGRCGRGRTSVTGSANALLVEGAQAGAGQTEAGEAACERARWAGWGPTCLPERLHFRGLLTALASKPVHILGGCPHHLVCLELTLVLSSVHL